jgi:prepilin-type N-terminal cleavage/methylation domain-containing protein
MQKKSNNKGFTIVEVLIVLAIAGVILATILLAVPALQRNSRNTQVKQAATALVAGAQEYASANNGAAPTTASFATPTVTWGATTNTQTKTTVAGGITVVYSAGSGTIPTTFSANTVYLITGAVCSGNTAVSGTGTAVVYTVEAGAATNTSGCVQG